jgi:hypothetical protein
VPIRWRLTVFNALAIGVILLLLGLGLYFLLRESLLSGVEGTVESRARIAARELEVDQGQDETPNVRLEGEVAAGATDRFLTRTTGSKGRSGAPVAQR